MSRHPSDAPAVPADRPSEATPSTRRALARKGAKIAFVVPAVVALKVNGASAGTVVTGLRPE